MPTILDVLRGLQSYDANAFHKPGYENSPLHNDNTLVPRQPFFLPFRNVQPLGNSFMPEIPGNFFTDPKPVLQASATPPPSPSPQPNVSSLLIRLLGLA